MRVSFSLSIVVLFLSSVCFGQLPSFRCDSIKSQLEDCTLLTGNEPVQNAAFDANAASGVAFLDSAMLGSPQNTPPIATDQDSAPSASTIAPAVPQKQGFHWHRALTESLTFLVIEQAYVVHSDFGWVVSENGVPFNHYWRDYMQSLSRWTHSGWNDGDPNWYGYVGHPIQGALTGFIEIQNDPQGEKQEFSRTKAYWWSRLKAGLFNAVYSTQWNLGPVSEVTVEKYGTKDRAPWNYNGSYPCSHHCLTGVGQIDVVMTPLGGTGWLIGEDFLDKNIVRRVEDSTNNRFLIDTVRCALNPVRGGANMLHGKHPWYRASRDAQGMSLSAQKTAVSTDNIPKTQVPNHGDVFFGYSHIGPTHCQAQLSDATTVCGPLSAKISNLGGWTVSVEKKYLRYFGAVADFSGQYGSVSQSSFLFGVRGGASLGRFRAFAEALVGALHTQENASAASKSDTSFAAALGVGAEFRLMRRLSWRMQADEIESSLVAGKQHNVRLSSGLAVRF